jgi:hypothetical protein
VGVSPFAARRALFPFIMTEQIEASSNDSKEDAGIPNEAKCIIVLFNQSVANDEPANCADQAPG